MPACVRFHHLGYTIKGAAEAQRSFGWESQSLGLVVWTRQTEIFGACQAVTVDLFAHSGSVEELPPDSILLRPSCKGSTTLYALVLL
jgi:hypothetical protein